MLERFLPVPKLVALRTEARELAQGPRKAALRAILKDPFALLRRVQAGSQRIASFARSISVHDEEFSSELLPEEDAEEASGAGSFLPEVNEYQHALAQGLHYFGLRDSLFPRGEVATPFGTLKCPPGMLEDLILYTTNHNALLSPFLADPLHPLKGHLRRLLWIVTHTVVFVIFCFVQAIGDFFVSVLIDIAFIAPFTLLAHRLFVSLLLCPCIAHTRNDSPFAQCMKFTARAAGGLLALPLLALSLLAWVSGAYLTAAQPSWLGQYVGKVLLLAAVLDFAKSLRHFWPGRMLVLRLVSPAPSPTASGPSVIGLLEVGAWKAERLRELGEECREERLMSISLGWLCCCCCCCCCCFAWRLELLRHEPVASVRDEKSSALAL